MREDILTVRQQDIQGAVNLNGIRDPPVPRMLRGSVRAGENSPLEA